MTHNVFMNVTKIASVCRLMCGKTCQLNRANKLSAKTSFHVKDGCRYYDFPVAEVSVDNKDILYVLAIVLNL